MTTPVYYRLIGRTDLAGEKGACFIYAGHLFGLALRNKSLGLFEELCGHELPHVLFFERFCSFYGIKPSLFQQPLCTLGWISGLAAGLAGQKYCKIWTHGIESVIEAHYHQQERMLKEKDALSQWLRKFAQEEAHHGAQAETKIEGVFSKACFHGVQRATRWAIWLVGKERNLFKKK